MHAKEQEQRLANVLFKKIKTKFTLNIRILYPYMFLYEELKS